MIAARLARSALSMSGRKRAAPAAAASAAKRPAAAAAAAAAAALAPGEVLVYPGGLVRATLLRRYKRFLGDVELAPGAAPVTVHVPNTGPMTTLVDGLPGAEALLSVSASKTRKYAHTLEWLRPAPGAAWVGVHSAKANAMVGALLAAGAVPGLPPFDAVRREVPFGAERSRVDFVLDHAAAGAVPAGECFVEVKSVTLAEDLPGGGGRLAVFPDTVSVRAQRHVRELTAVAARGGDAAMVFLVQRGDCAAGFAPSHRCDPGYGRLVVAAAAAGVRVVALAVELDADAGVVRFVGVLKVRLEHGL
jgi:sugar fermentation stimulation protein A